MLFNSYAFLLAFLPITVFGYFAIGRYGKSAGAAWLAICSLFFYAWWDYRYIALLLASVCANYFAGSYITKHPASPRGRRALTIGIAVNLLLLAYYKYADFFLTSSNSLLGTQWSALGVILPIGISFYTFTQIAFLADAYAGKVREYRFTYYLLFVTYFPHLIAGPVLHHSEMMPQFDKERNYRPHAANFVIGIAIFAIGLGKKVLIADNLAGYASPVFNQQADVPTLFIAWGGALAYSFQLYFDFSGYSDMAIGLSRLFGVRLPLNFNSPYKSRNIADFWRRWHITLSRFLRDYLYIPIGGNRQGSFRRQINLMITMVLGGLWHGAGWNFVVWGGLHGCFLVIHQGWQSLCRPLQLGLPNRLGKFLAIAMTFLCVVFAWVYFRAPDLATANRIIWGMLGGAGAAVPDAVANRLGLFKPYLEAFNIGSYLGGGSIFVETWAWVAVGAIIAFLTPNTQEIMIRFEPALKLEPQPSGLPPIGSFSWAPQKRYAVVIGLLLAFGMLALSRPTEFLYFQF